MTGIIRVYDRGQYSKRRKVCYDESMKEYPLEPGLLPIFRLYIILRLGVIMLVGGIYFTWYQFSFEPELIPYVILFLVDIIFLLVFLSWPWLKRRLGKIYLPIALFIASTGPIVEARYLFNVYEAGHMARLWMVFPFLLVPLILTTWQYELRHVIIFCLGTALMDMVLVRATLHLSMIEVLSEWGAILARTAFFILVGYIVSDLVAAQRRQRRELAEANLKLVRYATTVEQLTVSRERNRLARELHDTLAHTLSGLAVQLDAISTVWNSIPPKASAMLERALLSTRAGLDETRRALQALRATPLEDLGLALAVRTLAESAAARSAIALELDVQEQLNGLSPEVEQCYYRVAQEAIENVVKHAQADWLAVSLKHAGGQLILAVSDNGRGFEPGTGLSFQQFGLKGMQERADLIGGTLVLEAQPGQGTTIRLCKKEEEKVDDSRPDL